MNEFNSSLDVTNDLGNEAIRNSEIPESKDYAGEKSFSEAFNDALQTFVESVKELFGMGGDTSKDAKEVDETLAEKASDMSFSC
jgi:hypothetical protein